MRIAPLLVALALGLSACGPSTREPATPPVPPEYQAIEVPGPNGDPITIPAVKAEYLVERNRRQRVAYNGPERAGTIVVDPHARFLYHVLENGEAMRFGIAVGKAGLGFTGTGTVRRKEAWPAWTPTRNMVRRDPGLYGPVSGGLKGGLDNPLGARALYLYRGGRDTMYRIHGTMEPSSIGKATSAGCIRLFNQDILDLYAQAGTGTPVVVRTPDQSLAYEGEMVEIENGYLVPAGSEEALAFYKRQQEAAEAAAKALGQPLPEPAG